MNTAHHNQGTIDQKASSSSSSSKVTSSSSSSDEFSFTISLHPSSSSSSKPETPNDKTINQSPLTIDLSPADDIFFHGHLLPLSFLSHLPASPRTSTTSKPLLPPQETSTNNKYKTGILNRKLYSLFNPLKLRKGFASEAPERDESETNGKKMMRKIVKGYSRMVKPVAMMFRRSEKGEGMIRNAGFCSYSGDLRSSRRRDQGMRLGGLLFSAPVSLKTSPSNSGLLVPTKSLSPSSSKQSDSTTEEIQAAIQAAIAHCKNSFAVEEIIN